jgi:predicted NBD/HSP70 family sugar kinase
MVSSVASPPVPARTIARSGSGDTGRLVGANIEHAGLHNQRVVLHAIRIAGTSTRAAIAEVTGLTPATVSNITNRLLDEGYLERAGQQRGGRGQPATRLVIRPDGAFSIGINIDRDHLTMVAADFSGAVRARVSRDLSFPMPDDVRRFYRDEVAALLDRAEIPVGAITGIGVALPDDLGAVDLPGRPAGYDCWSTTDIPALFNEPFDVPVLVENDAAAAAIGEMQFGLGQHFASFFYLLVTFGLGGGVVVDALYDRGANGRSGEIGFMVVDDGTGYCIQLQHIVSLAGLSRAMTDAGLAGGVHDLELHDPAVAAVVDIWMERAAHALVQPLIAVNCLLNPGAVFIGGRLPITLVHRLARRTTELVGEQGRHVPVIAPIEAAALAEDSPAVGAALLPFGHLLLPADSAAIRQHARALPAAMPTAS